MYKFTKKKQPSAIMDNTSISKVLQNVFGPNFFCHIAPANGGRGWGGGWGGRE